MATALLSFQSLGFNEITPDFNRQFFEEFDVTNPEGITITGLWSQNLIPAAVLDRSRACSGRSTR